MIKTILAPFRAVMRFPLVQFAAVIFVIFLLQAADDNSIFGRIFEGLDKLTDETVQWASVAFTVKSFTKSWLTFGFMIAYVYLAFWLMLSICGARSRGIAAYRAWVPLEKIRPEHISQRDWEEQFAWPPNNRPPYRPLGQRVMRASLAYVFIVLVALAGFQLLTPFHVLSWLASAFGYKIG
jgi:hypothetical protein